MIRVARAGDAEAVQAIYAPCVTGSALTFETEVPDVAAMRTRMLDRLEHYPWLVLEEDGRVLAYAYASRFRERAAYDWIAETSVYTHADARRRGLARHIYGVLLDVLALQGLTQAVGVITLPGHGSVALHEAMGFAPAGVWRASGWKLGAWHDVGVWQRQLRDAPGPPVPTTPFARLAGTDDLDRLLAARC
ncbi:GNAT family N-acetyltransferase [Coralloluteibacterium stylophorae]|uniref:N-acetyltransferase n=1 Tax=Coralloluteibacterium stylophorae TaxID=1776034 RepID=A0A8J7VVK7_9GAMM|nr:GNAT family N-acetyltransferase [Coralloluteibacterium stylophorae]MBS7455870.1 N-acetyltransferase [Coralloluteibacterium stylophorae]